MEEETLTPSKELFEKEGKKKSNFGEKGKRERKEFLI